MATRSLTHIKNAQGNILCTVCRHSDGDPDGHGRELAYVLQDMIITDHIREDQSLKTAVGMECLAAQIVTELKQTGQTGCEDGSVRVVGCDRPQLGRVYLYPPGSKGYDESYIYTVYPEHVAETEDTIPLIKCEMPDGECLFDGTPDEFLQIEWE